VSGIAIRLFPTDIESIAFHSVGRGESHTAVQARLWPEAALRLQATDGWFPLYWQPDLSKRVPADLVAALAGFAPGRLTGPLKQKAEAAQSPKAPVHRRRTHRP
jgi:hypothetical protein